jgi:flagellar motor switch protein FliN
VSEGHPQGLIALGDVAVDVCVTLGEAQARVSDILRYASGTVIPLNCKADAPVRLVVNGTAVATGHIVESDEGTLAIEIHDVLRRTLPATA